MSYEIQRQGANLERDYSFPKGPQFSTVERQIERQLRQGKKRNALVDLVGQWPGDETDEEFEQLLKELD